VHNTPNHQNKFSKYLVNKINKFKKVYHHALNPKLSLIEGVGFIAVAIGATIGENAIGGCEKDYVDR
jgi:hypothetical protein